MNGATLTAALIVSTLAVGCGPTTNMALERARSNYQQAQRDPDISIYAPAALQEAQQSLQHAEYVWSNAKDSDEVTHLSYVTDQHVAIARATTEKNIAEAEIGQLSAERERVLLEARAREAARAQHAADAALMQAEQEAARARLLEQELVELKARETERGLVLTLGDVLFEYDRATLRPGAMQNLSRLAVFLRENPEKNLLIEGHTDSLGSDSYNRELSLQRAQAVESFLLQNGVDITRMITRGYGKSSPVASNDTEAGRQENRRVEIVILHTGDLASDRRR